MRFRAAALFLTCLFVSLPAVAQDSGRPNLTIGRATDAPVIDGVVDDAVWDSAPPFTTFIQQEPNEGEPASERTEIRFLLDRQNLYVSLICFDTEPQHIVVSQSRRDADLGDTDSVRILLDTFNDGQNAFVFGTNPFGIEYDGQVMAEGQTGLGLTLLHEGGHSSPTWVVYGKRSRPDVLVLSRLFGGFKRAVVRSRPGPTAAGLIRHETSWRDASRATEP